MSGVVADEVVFGLPLELPPTLRVLVDTVFPLNEFLLELLLPFLNAVDFSSSNLTNHYFYN